MTDTKVYEQMLDNFKANLYSDLKILSGFLTPEELAELIEEYNSKLYK